MRKNLAKIIDRGGKSSTPMSNLPSASSLVIGAMGAGSGAADAGGVPLRVATSGESGRAAPQRPTLIKDVDNIITRNEHTSRFLDNFLFCTNQPFSLVDNEYFLELIDAVKKAHPSWLPYHKDEARTRRLDVCMEGKEKDSVAYFKILDGVIKEIGPNAVVDVVMDNTRVCVKAGKMVEAAYPQIFCVGCTAHALDFALENMYKQLGWLAVVIDADNVVGKFFTNVDKARALFDKFSSNSKLKRPAVTRFATSHGMLASLKRGRNALEKCVCDTVWVDKMVRADQLAAFRKVTSIVLGRDGFWDKVDNALAVKFPVVELLRLVNGPGATMSKVYFKMDALIERMRGLDCVTPGEKADIEDILMHRWSSMTSELHCAAAFLDPKFRHSALAERDREVRAGFNILLYSWAPKDKPTLDELSRQVDDWTKLRGSFNTRKAAEAARVKPAALWWEAFGGKLDLLQPQAIKLLGQASSSAACERNWSLHELIFGRRRTKLMPERLSKLGRRADGEPKHKTGRPSNAELGERKAQKAKVKAAKAAAAAAVARSATARKGRKKKACSNVIDDNKSGDDAATTDDNEAAAAGNEAAAAPSSASSSSLSDDEDTSGSAAESMEHGEGDRTTRLRVQRIARGNSGRKRKETTGRS
ncbi:hypothetical protein CBR_g12905 [Chara braunii]|uniref:DUF659 domain-containing protein n=1 Tax=Chara braunii TaxID=69332 RepID=A0A388KT12_CHABU|nr:hypothetical protein CBR_g12905 [Chara braunii]|eukprot:GBG73187.1 hypothetical protein CBR_g12905 [Chara braunii]